MLRPPPRAIALVKVGLVAYRIGRHEVHFRPKIRRGLRRRRAAQPRRLSLLQSPRRAGLRRQSQGSAAATEPVSRPEARQGASQDEAHREVERAPRVRGHGQREGRAAARERPHPTTPPTSERRGRLQLPLPVHRLEARRAPRPPRPLHPGRGAGEARVSPLWLLPQSPRRVSRPC